MWRITRMSLWLSLRLSVGCLMRRAIVILSGMSVRNCSELINIMYICMCVRIVYIVRYYKVFMYIFVYERHHLVHSISDISEYSFFLLDHDTHQSPPDLHKSLILPNIQPQQTLPISISMPMPIVPSPFLLPCVLPLHNLCPKFGMMIIHTKFPFVIFDKSMHFRH